MPQGMMPLDFIAMIRSGQNPEQIMLNLLEQRAGDNPIAKNVLELAKDNQTSAIEQFARNFVQSQGKDFDTEFNSFKRKFGL